MDDINDIHFREKLQQPPGKSTRQGGTDCEPYTVHTHVGNNAKVTNSIIVVVSHKSIRQPNQLSWLSEIVRPAEPSLHMPLKQTGHLGVAVIALCAH